MTQSPLASSRSEEPLAYNPEREHSRLERKLTEVRGVDFLPAELLDLVTATISLQTEARAGAEPMPVDNPEDVERVLAGVPMVERERFPFDEQAALDLIPRVLDIAKAVPGNLGAAAANLEKAFQSGDLDPRDLFTAVLRTDESHLTSCGQTHTPEAPRLPAFVAQAAMSPYVAATAHQLFATLPQDRARAHGHCPVCGSLPYFSQLRDKEGHRHHTCSFCQTTYRARRLACPFCDEDRIDKLAYFQAEGGAAGVRVDACKTCNAYIKTADFRALDRFCLPALDDLTSLPLDLKAAEEGLMRPTLSAWGF